MLTHCTKLIPVLLTLLLFLQGTLPATAAEPVNVVVKLKPDADPVQLSNDYHAVLVGSVEPLFLHHLQKDDSDLLNDLLADPRVLTAEMDNYVEGQPRYADSGLNQQLEAQRRIIDADRRIIDADGDPGEELTGQWAAEKIRVLRSQTLLDGEGITVAVLDTGIDLDHPLLTRKLVPGYDFVDNDTDPDDAIDGIDEDEDWLIDEGAGHGTHVAGVVRLVAPEAKLMPVRIFSSDGSGTYFDVAAGIVFAVDNGAQVINISGSGPDDVDFFREAVEYAWDHGVLVVTSGGINRLGYPARYANVISVGATDLNDYRTDFSTFTDGVATAFAPGRSILSAFHSGEYAWWTGNSMATPFVAGEAALLLSSGSCDKYCVSNLIASQGRPVPQESILRVDLHDAVTTVLGQPDIDLSVQYMDGSGSPTNEQIKPFVNIVNNGTTLPLADLKLRYWFTNDGEGAPQFFTDFAPFGAANVTGKFVSIVPLPRVDRFLEVDFAPQAGVVYGGYDSGRAELRIMTEDFHRFNETDDYSFDVTKTGLADWDRVTLYRNGQLVWGQEPAGMVDAQATPTATSTPPTATTPTPTTTAASVVRDGWSRIEAESYDSSGGSLQVCGGALCYVGVNAWTQYDGVLLAGTNTIELSVANGGGNTDIQVWVGGVNVGTLTVGGTGGWNTYQTQSLTLPTQSEVQDVRLVFVNGNVNVDWFVFSGPPTATSTPPPTEVTSGPPYQAEDGFVGGDSTVETEHSGFYGSGYVNFPSGGGYVEYLNVDGGSGGSIILRFRFALGASSSRTGQLTVNGASQDITFNPTGGWNVWAIKEVKVNLNGGTSNTIRLESTGQDLANQDQLDIVGGTVASE